MYVYMNVEISRIRRQYADQAHTERKLHVEKRDMHHEVRVSFRNSRLGMTPPIDGIYSYMYVYVKVFIYVYMYVCMHVCIHMHVSFDMGMRCVHHEFCVSFKNSQLVMILPIVGTYLYLYVCM